MRRQITEGTRNIGAAVMADNASRVYVLSDFGTGTPYGFFYNVGTGERTTLRTLAEMLLQLTGSDLEVHYEPAAQVFVTNRVGSTELARADLDFTAGVDLEEGLAQVIAWRAAHKDQVERRRRQGDGEGG